MEGLYPKFREEEAKVYESLGKISLFENVLIHSLFRTSVGN